MKRSSPGLVTSWIRSWARLRRDLLLTSSPAGSGPAGTLSGHKSSGILILVRRVRKFVHTGVDLYREVILTEDGREPHDGLRLFSSLDSNRYISNKSNPTYQTWLEFVTL